MSGYIENPTSHKRWFLASHILGRSNFPVCTLKLQDVAWDLPLCLMLSWPSFELPYLFLQDLIQHHANRELHCTKHQNMVLNPAAFPFIRTTYTTTCYSAYCLLPQQTLPCAHVWIEIFFADKYEYILQCLYFVKLAVFSFLVLFGAIDWTQNLVFWHFFREAHHLEQEERLMKLLV